MKNQMDKNLSSIWRLAPWGEKWPLKVLSFLHPEVETGLRVEGGTVEGPELTWKL